MKTAALYSCGKVFVAKSHLEAYGMLSQQERENIVSGFFDPDTGEFDADNYIDHFYQKQILLIRHGKAKKDSINPDLTAQGIQNIKDVTKYLGQLDLTEYQGFVSPLLRCLQSAKIIKQFSNIKFEVKEEIMETPTFLEEGQSFDLKSQKDEFDKFDWPQANNWIIKHETENEFIKRVGLVLQQLPKKSILVSHFGVVLNMAKLALCGEKCEAKGVPTASLTFIDNQEIKCYGKSVE